MNFFINQLPREGSQQVPRTAQSLTRRVAPK
jgi:hypothetical protein